VGGERSHHCAIPATLRRNSDSNRNDFLSCSPGSPDCDFEENMCDWDVQQGWVLTKRLEGFETSGKVLFSEGDSVVVHVLQHAPIHVKKVFISKVHEKY